MNEEELQKLADEIIKIAEADREWIKEQEDFSEDFKEGWKRGIDQLVLELLGRKEEDEVEKLKQIIL